MKEFSPKILLVTNFEMILTFLLVISEKLLQF